MSTALDMASVYLLHKSVIALTDGRELAVIFPIVPECQIAMHLEPVMEGLIHRSA